jgi:sensor histidine kinase YesM
LVIQRVSDYFDGLVSAIYSRRAYQYWLLQFLGWGGLGMITFFSLTLWYASATWDQVLHTTAQCFLGFMLSLPLHAVCRSLWQRSMAARLGWTLLAIVVVSVLWTVLKMYAFIFIIGYAGIWEDFGGWFFSSFLVYLCWAALYYGNKYYYQAEVELSKRQLAAVAVKEEQLKRLNAEAEARSAQLGMLQYQLNPHFLFNTLNSISALVKLDENAKARQMISQLGDFLRYSLDNDPAMMLSLQQEVDALMLHLDIEKTRFGARLNLQFDIAEDAGNAQVPSLLLQPLVENAIKYAVAVNESGGTIALKARVENKELVLELSDAGPGKDPQRPKPKSGRRVGLHNTLQRLRTLYDEAYLFDIDLNQTGGLKINIRIPYSPVE